MQKTGFSEGPVKVPAKPTPLLPRWTVLAVGSNGPCGQLSGSGRAGTGTPPRERRRKELYIKEKKDGIRTSRAQEVRAGPRQAYGVSGVLESCAFGQAAVLEWICLQPTASLPALYQRLAHPPLLRLKQTSRECRRPTLGLLVVCGMSLRAHRAPLHGRVAVDRTHPAFRR